MSDVVADGMMSFVIGVRLRRRKEPQLESVEKLISTLREGRGEKSMRGTVITADRGCGKKTFADLFHKKAFLQC